MNNVNEKFIKTKWVLNLINEKQLVSRSELKNYTGIRLATLTNITKELIEDGIILEGGNRPDNGKLKKKELYINKDFRYIIGVDIQPDRIVTVITDFHGNILEKARRDLLTNATKENIINDLLSTIENLALNIDKNKLLGIGISLPAALDKDKNTIILSSPIEQLSNTLIKPLIEKHFNLPVYIDTSNNLYLLAEKWFGCAKKSEDVIYIELGSGIAVSIISNGNFVKGYSGIEGELGHTVVDPNGGVCICGNRGCLETVASSRVIKKKVKSILNRGTYSSIWDLVGGNIDKVSIDIIIKAAEMGDKVSQNVLEDSAKFIGISIANVINIVGPEVVIFGGDAVHQTNYFVDMIIHAVKSNILVYICKELEFKVSELKHLSGVLGAVALVLDNYYMNSKLKNMGLLK